MEEDIDIDNNIDIEKVLKFKLGMPNSELNEVNWEGVSRDRRERGGLLAAIQLSRIN